MRKLSFAKGHGTKNDFVIVVDRHGVSPLSDADVRFLCDRRAGIGGDGLLRVIKAAHVPGWEGDPNLWFMDYRNADGSVAEMCGNGLRVFARYLQEEDLIAENTITVGTRAGARTAFLRGDGLIQAEMGRVDVGTEDMSFTADGHTFSALPVSVGNPHVVTFVGQEELARLSLTATPQLERPDAFPRGANIEFVHVVGERELSMRVFERGVGETQSCGTGTVAAVAAASSRLGLGDGTFSVRIPGGVVSVELGDGRAWLTGPAVIVAHGEVNLPDGP